jgi:hypothetical protein
VAHISAVTTAAELGETAGLYLGDCHQGRASHHSTSCVIEDKDKNLSNKGKTMNKTIQLEGKVGRSWGKHEGEPSAEVCDKPGRTRGSSRRQLPTDHDYAVPTREYQLDQSSPLPASAAADPVLDPKNDRRTLTGHYISTSGLPVTCPERQVCEHPVRRAWNTLAKTEAGS